ncbi:MAG: Acetyl-CoA:oxalate CoA-transferase [Rhodocyclaceae bacterium]|nr:Acetyl-CoA:oxalate CoA-transferase [Rhodocyclaceae bacterium]
MFPLKGVRVLDLSKILAGPLCTQYLGELGAEVIKIEPPEGGDDTRSWPPRKDGQGAVFLAVNRNKQSVAIDLKSPEGVEIVKKIAKSAQVVVESYGTGVAERLGIDYRSLREVNPSLVYCAISGYGRTGPMGQQPGYDLMGQAFSGIMSLTGEKDGGPIRSPFSPLDQTTGMHALVGVLAGLMNRQQTGEGKYMEVSLFETALAFLAYNAQSYWVKGVVPERFGSGHESLCPYQAFEAADGYVLLGVGNDNLWRKFCAVSGLQAIQDDPKFKTNPDRVAHFDETVRVVADVMKRQTVDAWVEILQRAGVPCAPINPLDKVLAHPQTTARHMVMDYQHPFLGAERAVAQPIWIEGRERKVLAPPPMLGQHTRSVLSQLGYAAAEIDHMAERGTVLLGPETA